MSKPNLSQIQRICGSLTSLSLGLTSLGLMGSCLRIYQAGDFTREIVAEKLSGLALPMGVTLGLVAAGLVLDLFRKQSPEKPRAGKQTGLLLSRLAARADLTACPELLADAVAAQRKIRQRLRWLRLATFALSAIVFLVYALDGSHFHTSQINQSMIRAMTVLLPCLTVSGAAALVTGCLDQKSMESEIALLKQAPVLSPADRPQAAPRSGKIASVLPAAILLLAIALALFGFFTGGTADVLTKAVNICTECVGLG